MSMPGRTGGFSDVRSLLEGVRTGAMSVDQALSLFPLLQIHQLDDFARLDLGRATRKGVPEVIFSPGKSDEAFVAIVQAFVGDGGVALAARVTPARAALVERALGGAPVAENPTAAVCTYHEQAGTLVAAAAGYVPPSGRGVVGIISAGTADVSAAEEAGMVATHMGCRVLRAHDVGVAGVHRLLEPLADMVAEGGQVLGVAAGLEGALPSVVAGLVDIPVIGLPTSTGYGMGGAGTAALLSILQTCTPGLVAVNIDNGVGAGAAAGLIARGQAGQRS